MTISEYLSRIRRYLYDPEGEVWSDDELLLLLDEAVRCFCADTGLYRGCISILTDNCGRVKMPRNYISLIAGWNPERSMKTVSVDVLDCARSDYIIAEGMADYIYEDLDSGGTLRLCPNPNRRQNIRVYKPGGPYGIPVLSGYGIPFKAETYGIPVLICRFISAGDLVYIRVESPERIADYMSIICHVLYQAYLSDGDFQDENRAQGYYQIYKSRIDRLNQLRTVPAIRKRSNFY